MINHFCSLSFSAFKRDTLSSQNFLKVPKKMLKFTFLLLAVAAGVNCFELPSDLLEIPSLKNLFVNSMSDKIVDTIITAAINKNNEGTLATIIPPQPDLITINPVKLPIDLTIDWDENSQIKISGHFELTTPAELRGLDGMTNNYEITVIPLRPAEFTLRVDIPKLEITGEYDLLLNVDLITSTHNITGSGNLAASVENVFLDVFAKLKAAGNLAILELELDLGFQNLNIDGGLGQVDGAFPIDWGNVSSNLQTYFDTLWTNNDEVKGIVTEAVRLLADNIVKDCTLAELLLGNTDCLNLPTPRTTTEDPGTGTTTTTTPGTGTPDTTTQDPGTGTPPTTTPPTTTPPTTTPPTTTPPTTTPPTNPPPTTTPEDITTTEEPVPTTPSSGNYVIASLMIIFASIFATGFSQ